MTDDSSVKKTGNDLTTTESDNLPTAEREAEAFAAAAAGLNGTSLPPILKMSKNGEFVTGAENEPLAETRFAVDVRHATRGAVCFVDGDCVDEVQVPVASGKTIDIDKLPDHGPYSEGDGWVRSASIQLRSVETGEAFAFKPTSQGGLKAIAGLLDRYSYHRSRGNIGIPIVDLSVSSYEHKRYGRVYTPKLKIVAWEDEADLVNSEGGSEPTSDSIPF